MSRPITITPVANGFIVQAGCLTLVFANRVELADELRRWVTAPDVVEEQYQKRYYPGTSGERSLAGISIGGGEAAAPEPRGYEAPFPQLNRPIG